MAASGLVGITEAAVIEMSMKHKIPRVQLVKLKGIFHGNFESNGARNGSDIAKCLEKLNGVLPKQSIEPYLKTSLANFTGLFGKESFTNRLERSPSTDSIAVSNFSSDQGSIDSCHYSSNGSDSNSGSSPSSPEEPDRCSRAGSPQSMPPTSPPLHYDFQGEDPLCPMDESYRTEAIKYRTDGEDLFKRSDKEPSSLANERLQGSEDSKLFYLQQRDCSVPNSTCESFQSFEPQSCVPSVVQNGESSNSASWDKTASNSCEAVAAESKADFVSSNGTNQSNCSSTDMQQCNWVNCEICLEGNTELVEHIRTQHVQVQKDKESFVCLWVGCKVYDRSSCSLSWLERHVLCHGGNKPFKCIVDNCSQRFPTQAALQRHVNSHFDSHPNSHSGKMGRCKDETTAKSFRKKRSAKCKKRSAIGKIAEDFFDANVMEQIRYRLVEVHSSQPLDSTNLSGSITFHSRVRGVRTDKSGEVKVLLHWLPENILPDSWVSEKCVVKSKRVPYSSLPPGSLASLHPQFKDVLDEAPRVKQRRK